jgi:hypothetical protein
MLQIPDSLADYSFSFGQINLTLFAPASVTLLLSNPQPLSPSP